MPDESERARREASGIWYCDKCTAENLPEMGTCCVCGVVRSFKALGQKVTVPTGELETFTAPQRVITVEFTTTEVTALCPVTGQPDWYDVSIRYCPDKACIESKSLKLYLWQFREEGHFCEQLAQRVLEDCKEACDPIWMVVEMTMAPRGGIAITAKAQYPTQWKIADDAE